jgi:hypothetical protein
LPTPTMPIFSAIVCLPRCRRALRTSGCLAGIMRAASLPVNGAAARAPCGRALDLVLVVCSPGRLTLRQKTIKRLD